jgi:hypothetical protein
MGKVEEIRAKRYGTGGEIKKYKDGGNIEGFAGGETGKSPEEAISAIVVDGEGKPAQPVELHGKELIITAEENDTLRSLMEEGNAEEVMNLLAKILEKADAKKEVTEEVIEEDQLFG